MVRAGAYRRLSLKGRVTATSSLACCRHLVWNRSDVCELFIGPKIFGGLLPNLGPFLCQRRYGWGMFSFVLVGHFIHIFSFDMKITFAPAHLSL